MEICLLGPYPPRQAGTEIYVMKLAEKLSKMGHNVVVVSYRGSVRVNNERVISLPTLKRPLRGLSFIYQCRKRINKILNSYGFDVLSAHYALTSGECLRSVGIGIPWTITCHGSDVIIPTRNIIGRAFLKKILIIPNLLTRR